MKRIAIFTLLLGGLFLLAGCVTTQPETATTSAAATTTAGNGHQHQHGTMSEGGKQCKCKQGEAGAVGKDCPCKKGEMAMGGHAGHGQHKGMMAPQNQEERRDALYTCACGPACDCNTVSVKPGVCRCGQPLKWGHVLKIEGNEALVCQCQEGCTCALDPKDPSKCGCGKSVKRVNLKGSGLYFCNCGGACFCNTASDQPGQCKCGMQLKKVD